MSEIKVTDRRMFTADGRIREEFERQLAEEAAEPVAEELAVTEPAPPAASDLPTPVDEVSVAPTLGAQGVAPQLPFTFPADPPPGLLELVEFLAGWALASMGDVPLPDGRMARNLDAARFYIDWIGVLHEQYAQKLPPQDSQFLESYLDQLRLRFVSYRG